MNDDFDWGAWLDSQAGSASPQGSYDIDELLGGYLSDPSIAYASSSRGADTLSAMGATNDTAPGMFDQTIGAVRGLFGNKGADLLKTYGPKLFDAATSKGGLAALMALLAALDKQKPRGGGTTMAYPGAKQYTRTVGPGAGGTPIARYAANGGMMHAYAGGGPVQMEDGGFVLTKQAVDGAGGPRGIQQLVPDARMIRGPGTGTSDEIPAVINGRNGQTPARLSNGEAYVPRTAVEDQGGAQRMYALMNSLQRRA